MFQPKFLKNFPFGLFLGAIGSLALAWSIDATVADAIHRNILYLTSAGMTLVAASIALAGVLSNIENQNNSNDRIRVAKLAAAKAVLPMALSELSDICSNRIQFEIDSDTRRKGHSWIASGTTLNTLREVIEFSEGSGQEALKEIALIYQIVVARGESQFNNEATPIQKASELDKLNSIYRISDWVSFKCIVENCFPFARDLSCEVHRSKVIDLAIPALGFLENEGWVLENDSSIREIFDRFREKKDFGFCNPNWPTIELPIELHSLASEK